MKSITMSLLCALLLPIVAIGFLTHLVIGFTVAGWATGRDFMEWLTE